MPEGSPGTGFDIRRLFSPDTQAREGREDPRTEPHAPVHAAPENPTPITLEDMSERRILVSPREEPSLMGGQEGCRFTSSKPNSKQMKSDQRTMGPVRAVTVYDVTSGVVRVTFPISGARPLARCVVRSRR